MKKTTLKQGDKVFNWWRQEWETVKDIVDDDSYPIKTNQHVYNIDGKYRTRLPFPSLSLTEYNPFDGTGIFTPIYSEPQPQIGDMVWGWDDESGFFGYGEFVKKDCSKTPFKVEFLNGEYSWFKHISLTPPEWILKHINK